MLTKQVELMHKQDVACDRNWWVCVYAVCSGSAHIHTHGEILEMSPVSERYPSSSMELETSHKYPIYPATESFSVPFHSFTTETHFLCVQGCHPSSSLHRLSIELQSLWLNESRQPCVSLRIIRVEPFHCRGALYVHGQKREWHEQFSPVILGQSSCVGCCHILGRMA